MDENIQNLTLAFVTEKQVRSQIQNIQALLARHEDIELQEKMLNFIPVDELHEEAKKMEGEFLENLVKCLLKWFKGWFKWMNEPTCHCQLSTKFVGQSGRLDSERGASRVEIYSCPSGHTVRFPRYNDPERLLETRCGRCGEWANVFCLVTKSMGYETRYVLDLTDHVWGEIWSEPSQRWIHVDSCEAAFDTPFLYESGWKKKLKHIFAITTHQVVDVTFKYAKEPTLIISPARLSTIVQSSESDSASSTTQLPVRQSGSLDWRQARGEC